MEEFYFYNIRDRKWCAYWEVTIDANFNSIYKSIDPKIEAKLKKASQNPTQNSDFIILENKIYGGIPTKKLYIPIDAEEIRFVGKDFIYLAGAGKRYTSSSGRSCVPTSYVCNPKILCTINTQYPYVVDFIDKMQRDTRPYNTDDEQANYIRAKNCFEALTDDQKLYYTVNGDGKYLF